MHSPLMTIKEKLNRSRIHPVPGYSDSENMWQRLANIEKEAIPNPNKHPNNKSLYTIQVQDKIFRMRKNPAYTGPLNLPELPPDPVELLAQEQEAQAIRLSDEDKEHEKQDFLGGANG